MNETVFAVIIGGLIASIAPVAGLIIDHRRWKREARLEYLKGERARLETLYAETLEKLGDALSEKSYPSTMISDINVLMPPKVSDKFNEWMESGDRTDERARLAYLSISTEMKRSLALIDDQIRQLVSS